MTVESTNNKQAAQQMGTLYNYDFTLDVLLQDPTAADALKAIKAVVKGADGAETQLEYGTDYSVVLNADRSGGYITVVDKRTSSDYITIYREYSSTQNADYQDFNAAPADTFEQCFDKLTMLTQQQQEELDRSVKVSMTSEISPEMFAGEVERIYDSVDNIDTVAGIKDDVETVADDSSDIQTCASNITDIQNAATNAQSAALSAALAKQYAIGDPSEPTGHSAKYWAEQAAAGLTPATTTTLGGVIIGNGLDVQNDGTISVNGGALPSQTGNAGKVLTTDGTDASWGATAQVYPVIETYSNGTSWYIVYAPDSNNNCFCIQGSLYYKGTTIAGDNTVAFLKEFADTNYTFLALPAHSSANVSANTFAEKYASRTTAQTILYSPGALFGYQWVAYGYVSMGS